MARFTLLSMISTITLFLPASFCRPFELPNDLLNELDVWLSLPPNYHSSSFAPDITPSPNTPSSQAQSTGIPGTGSFTILPTGSFTILLTATGTGGATITTTGVATGTATSAASSSFFLNKREADELALKKRRAFEGPRHRHFPHYWPHYAVSSDGGDSMPTAQPSVRPTGTAPVGTGLASGVTSGILPTVTVPIA